jgi:hypothetical protein
VSQSNWPKKWNGMARKSRESGVRMQPTAQAVGKKRKSVEPQRGERVVAHSIFSRRGDIRSTKSVFQQLPESQRCFQPMR